MTRSRMTKPAVALVAVLSLGLASCGEGADKSAEASGEVDCPITIGASISLTGMFSEQGPELLKGYEAWVQEVNDSGGLLGCEVELVHRDDESDDQTAVAVYEDYASSGEVDLVVGPFSSKLVIPTSQAVHENEMLFVLASGNAPDVFEPGYDNQFLAALPLASDRPEPLGDWILSLPESERPATAAYASADNPFQQATTKALREQLEAGGIETVADEVYLEEGTDFAVLAAKIADTEAELFFGGTNEPEAAELVRGFGTIGYEPDIVVLEANHDSFWSDAGEDAQGVMTLLNWAADMPYPGNDEFLAAYDDAFDAVPTDDVAVFGYAVGQVLRAAVESVGCADPSADCQRKLAEHLHASSVETIFGTISWDDVGRPDGITRMVGQWNDGVLEVVLATDPEVATVDVVFPWRSEG